MLELLNIRINFLCTKTYENDEGKYPIVMRIIFRDERRDIFTGIYCEKKEWDSKHNRLFRLNKYSNSVNSNLDLIQRKAFEVFENLKYTGLVFTIDELVDTQVLLDTLRSLNEEDLEKTIYVRHEAHSVLEAINRQLAHYPYHIGQIVFIGKMCAENWSSLTIPKGRSEEYNRQNLIASSQIRKNLCSRKKALIAIF
jgi:hypothetical protein